MKTKFPRGFTVVDTRGTQAQESIVLMRPPGSRLAFPEAISRDGRSRGPYRKIFSLSVSAGHEPILHEPTYSCLDGGVGRRSPRTKSARRKRSSSATFPQTPDGTQGNSGEGSRGNSDEISHHVSRLVEPAFAPRSWAFIPHDHR